MYAQLFFINTKSIFMKNTYTSLLGILFLLILSCKNEQPSLQQYLVESYDKENMLNFTFSSGMINTYLLNASQDIKEALGAVHKIHIVALPIKEDGTQYETEKQELVRVFKDNITYKPLIAIKNNGTSLRLYSKGEEKVKEIVVFGFSDEQGLGLARILGDNMNPEKIIEAVKEIPIPSDNPEFEKIREELKRKL